MWSPEHVPFCLFAQQPPPPPLQHTTTLFLSPHPLWLQDQRSSVTPSPRPQLAMSAALVRSRESGRSPCPPSTPVGDCSCWEAGLGHGGFPHSTPIQLSCQGLGGQGPTHMPHHLSGNLPLPAPRHSPGLHRPCFNLDHAAAASGRPRTRPCPGDMVPVTHGFGHLHTSSSLT